MVERAAQDTILKKSSLNMFLFSVTEAGIFLSNFWQFFFCVSHMNTRLQEHYKSKNAIYQDNKNMIKANSYRELSCCSPAIHCSSTLQYIQSPFISCITENTYYYCTGIGK